MSIRPITDTLRLLDGGAFLDQASEQLNLLVKRVDETRKAGRLTLTIELRPARAAGAMEVTPTVAARLPEPSIDATLLWTTDDGNLSVENPRQQKLDLRRVDEATGEIRDLTAVGAGPLKAAT